MGKIISAKLHAGVFLAGKNLGSDLSTHPGAKQVAMTMQDSFLKVTIGNHSILVPFTNVQQITMVDEPKTNETNS